ncbi:MAG: transcription termination/antitermination NusG family protein [Planctomycetota bacterium]|jgi:transcription antitermination factor NusG
MVLKLSENPPMLWPEETSIADFQGQWWVAHTKSRNEKALAWQLTNADVPYFLPMHWKVSKSRGRTIRSLLPLFPSYLFFCGSEDHRLAVLKTNRTANILPVEDQQLLVRELLPIETMLKLGKTVLPHEYIQLGQKYRVIAGPLQGAEGIVIATPKETRLILQIDMLGQAASVEIAADMIEKLDE